jgi:hypothetical protein
LLEPISKPPFAPVGHSERREASRIFNKLRSFTPFRMTGKIGFAIGFRIPQGQIGYCPEENQGFSPPKTSIPPIFSYAMPYYKKMQAGKDWNYHH